MTSLKHTKALSKGKMRANVTRKQHPPIVNVCCVPHSISPNLLHTQQRLLPHDWLPVLYKVRSAETPGQELPAGSVLSGINHGEDTGLGEIGQSLIPVRFEILGPDLVDLSEGVEVCHTDFIRRETNNRAIFLMKRVDVEDALASDYSTFQTEMSEACIPRSREMSRGTCKTDVGDL
jgi:hypothetical protein